MQTIIERLDCALKSRSELAAEFAEIFDKLGGLYCAIESTKNEIAMQSTMLNVLTTQRKKDEEIIKCVVDNYIKLCKLTTKMIRL